MLWIMSKNLTKEVLKADLSGPWAAWSISTSQQVDFNKTSLKKESEIQYLVPAEYGN